MEIVPERTASTSSGAAAFWIFSIWLIWLLLKRAALATSSRVLMGGFGAFSPSGASAALTGAGLRAATISFLRKASTPRWKSDTLRRAR